MEIELKHWETTNSNRSFFQQLFYWYFYRSSKIWWLISFILSLFLLIFFFFILSEKSHFGLFWTREPKSFFYDENHNLMATASEYIGAIFIYLCFTNHIYRILLEIRRLITSKEILLFDVTLRDGTKYTDDSQIKSFKFMSLPTRIFYLSILGTFLYYGQSAHWLSIGWVLGLFGFYTLPNCYVFRWVN